MIAFHKIARVSALFITCSGLSGCLARSPIPAFFADPYRVDSDIYQSPRDISYTNADAEAFDRQINSSRGHMFANDAGARFDRNNFITLKMNLIDKAYYIYEAKLTHDDSSINLFGTLASLGLTTAAATIPAGQTTKILAAAATAVGASTVAYDKDILLSQTIQALQSQMRADRAKIAATIYVRMKSCGVLTYPPGLAYSDLEQYERVGTIASAIIGVNKTVSKAQDKAEANKAIVGGVDTSLPNSYGASNLAGYADELDTLSKNISGIVYNPCPLGIDIKEAKNLKPRPDLKKKHARPPRKIG